MITGTIIYLKLRSTFRKKDHHLSEFGQSLKFTSAYKRVKIKFLNLNEFLKQGLGKFFLINVA
jgi:hypothetical protein